MVREIKKSDFDGFYALYVKVDKNSGYENRGFFRDRWEKMLGDPNYHLVVYETEGKIVSFCTLAVIEGLGSRMRPFAFIETVVTDESFRNQGYAAWCMDYAKEIAIEENCSRIVLLASGSEKEAVSFYEHIGYIKEDETVLIQHLH